MTYLCHHCFKKAVSMAYCSQGDHMVSVCLEHITVYKVKDGRYWQAEDEWADLRFCRRSRFKRLAQWKIYRDQMAALAGQVSRAQQRLTRKAAKR